MLPSEDMDWPTHSCGLLRIFAVHVLDGHSKVFFNVGNEDSD